MGRKAKLKQLKKQEKQENQADVKTSKIELDTNEFVKEIEHKGYSFKQIKRSPEVPGNKIEPQI